MITQSKDAVSIYNMRKVLNLVDKSWPSLMKTMQKIYKLYSDFNQSLAS